MYKEHEQLPNSKGNDKIWKYMNLPKFLNLLNGNLYFNRIDQFEDVFEATYPEFNKRVRKGNGQPIPRAFYDQVEEGAQNWFYVSCFHKSEQETAFMWKQYSEKDGIAIVSSIERLKQCFSNVKENIYICDVQYIDFDAEFMPENNIIHLALYKRKSFQAEQEVRCLYFDHPSYSAYNDQTGILFPVDLKQLISKVYISPYAPKYLEEDVRILLTKYNLPDVEVVYSPLYTIK